MSRMSDTSREKAESAAKGVRNAAAEVQQNLRDMGGQVRDAAREKYDELRETAGEYYEQGRQRAEEWEHSIESYVQEKPLQSLVIAAGVGLLLGLFWKRH